ncbi:MAG: PKD domain-containing protein, partial [Bacteroidales bacterium]|nr:PKD domain-containing protein [Bacteroidales bacterium]
AAGTYTVTLKVTDANGFTNSIKHKVFVSNNPKVDFSYGRACETDSVYFYDKTVTSSGVLTSFAWSFGDTTSVANQSNQENPVHYFIRGGGSYKVRLVATNNYGCYDSISKYVKVHDSPKAGFIYNQLIDPMTEVSFTDTSQQSRDRSPIKSYLWSFYNGDVSDSVNPAYNFPNSGKCYPVTLTVTDTNGCSNTDTTDVCLVPPPPVDFTMSDDSICLGDRISFSGKSSNLIIHWHWDFGDGDTSMYQNQTYRYPAAGTYTVTLTVTDLNGFSNSVKHKVFVSGNPKADFIFGKTCQTDSVYFSDRTLSPSGVIVSRSWDFDDTTSTTNHSTQQTPAHYFSRGAGSYHVRLYVVNTFGCSDTVYKYVNVHTNPKAAFTYNQLSDPVTKVLFSDSSKESRDGSPIISRLWNFYNGDVSDSVNPSYNFPDYGQCYPVTLMVTDTNGCSNTDTIDVCLLPPASLNFSTTRVCVGNKTSFNATYMPSADTIGYYYKWDFGDGSTQVYTYYDTITHHFNKPGVYNVQLTAVGTSGPKISITHQTVIDSLPDPSFTFITPSCDQATTFEAPTWGGGCPIKSWSWNFGDTTSGVRNTSAYWNPSHLFISKDSTYHVSLTVINANGCIDSVTKPIVRSSCAYIYFTAANSECTNSPVYFKDRTSLNSSLGRITQWTWDFGDGATETYTSHQDSIYHVYKSAGSYKVTMTEKAIVNNLPSTGSYDSVILVKQSPQANFGFGPACIGQTVYFIDSTWTNNVGLSQWRWTFNDPSSSEKYSNVQNPRHIYRSPGYYSAQLVVTDNDNCSDTATKNVQVHTPPIASFEIDPNYNGVSGQLYFNNTSMGAESYFWEFGDGAVSTEENPVYSYSTSGHFNVLLVATNVYSCSDTATSAYDFTSGLYVPNSFAPGSDNAKINIFEPVGVHLKKYDIQVYSAWGNLLWESTKLDVDGRPVEGWDGTYKGQPMPEGDYIWKISAEFLDGTSWKGSDNGDGNKNPYGTVLLIR